MTRRAEVPCREQACRQPVIFGFNRKTRHHIPLDPTPDDAGNLAGHVDQHGTLIVRAPTVEDGIDPWERWYMPHAATCKAKREPQPERGLAAVIPFPGPHAAR